MLLYCFHREDFPWIALWEENRARPDPPWNGTTQARGMEFGTTPMPLGREAIHAMGPLFDTPVERVLPAGGSYAARYAVCLAALSVDARTIEHVTIADEAFIVKLAGRGRKITPARCRSQALSAAERRSTLKRGRRLRPARQ